MLLRVPGYLYRYATSAPAIGTPKSVLRSCRNSAFVRSPTKFTVRTTIPSQQPQVVFLASPIAASPHAVPTVAISKIDNQPSDSNAACASGFNRHNESSLVSGKISSTMVKAHMQVPNAKKSASNFIPTGVAFLTACFCTISLTTRHNVNEFA
jgi:hypothetical protein